MVDGAIGSMLIHVQPPVVKEKKSLFVIVPTLSLSVVGASVKDQKHYQKFVILKNHVNVSEMSSTYNCIDLYEKTIFVLI